jgi:hypothetical protein
MVPGMLETLNTWDTQLFLFFNGMHSPFWDSVMSWVSEKTSWIPLYLGLVGWLAYAFRWKAVDSAEVAALVAASDRIGVPVQKSSAARPCHGELAAIMPGQRLLQAAMASSPAAVLRGPPMRRCGSALVVLADSVGGGGSTAGCTSAFIFRTFSRRRVRALLAWAFYRG